LDSVKALLRPALGPVIELRVLLLACVDCTEGLAAPGAVAAALLLPAGWGATDSLWGAALRVLVRGAVVALLLPFLDCIEGVDCAEALVAA
jgi:hypothetical protein